MSSPYLLNKIARHGEAIIRLKSELQDGKGEFADMPPHLALAFDAADFVWAYLASEGDGKVLRERQIRNEVAEAVHAILRRAQADGRLLASDDSTA